MRILAVLAAATASVACLAMPAAATDGDVYDARFLLTQRAGNDRARGRITIVQPEPRLVRLRFNVGSGNYSDFEGDGRIETDGDYVDWQVPGNGGSISYRVRIDNRRRSAYDALVTDSWAIFRGDDVFPAARATHRGDARSRSWLAVRAPEGWAVETPYLEDASGRLPVSNPARRFDRPVGWIMTGRLGVRKDLIAGTEVSVAGPVGINLQRLPTLALLRWTLPWIANHLDAMPERINIVSAGEPMWRGGLSAPNSLFVHADRPLISENATSTLLHEILHVIAPVPTAPDADWIDEGLAEYLTLRVLEQTGTIAPERFDKAIEDFRQRGNGARTLRGRSATGERRARAVAIMADLDRELRRRSQGKVSLMKMLPQLMSSREPLDAAGLRRLAAAALDDDTPLSALSEVRLASRKRPE